MILRDLNQTLSSDYRSLAQVKHSCQLRLDDMRNAAVKVEEDFNTILDLEKEMHALHPNSNFTHGRIITEIMSEVSHAADSLESQLSAADIFQDSQHQEGAALETVVKLQEAAVAEHLNLVFVNKRMPVRGGGEEGGGRGVMSVLVDSASNQYVLSRPRDATVPIEDHQFIHDIVSLLLLSFALGTLCSLIKVPPLLGYIMAGLLLGPFGYNTITSVVQVIRSFTLLRTAHHNSVLTLLRMSTFEAQKKISTISNPLSLTSDGILNISFFLFLFLSDSDLSRLRHLQPTIIQYLAHL